MGSKLGLGRPGVSKTRLGEKSIKFDMQPVSVWQILVKLSEQIRFCDMENITIFTDSLSTLQVLNTANPDQIIQGLHSSLAKLTAQFPVSLLWVPAHMGLTGNETADRLATIGSQTLQTQNLVTYKDARTLLHSRFKGDWQTGNGGHQAHLDLIRSGPIRSLCI